MAEDIDAEKAKAHEHFKRGSYLLSFLHDRFSGQNADSMNQTENSSLVACFFCRFNRRYSELVHEGYESTNITGGFCQTFA